MAIRIEIADNHAILGQGRARILEGCPGLIVVAEATSEASGRPWLHSEKSLNEDSIPAIQFIRTGKRYISRALAEFNG